MEVWSSLDGAESSDTQEMMEAGVQKPPNQDAKNWEAVDQK